MMIIAILGYMILFMAVDYGRKEDSKIHLFSWKGLVVFCLIVLGSILVEKGHEKESPRQRIHIEQRAPSKFQQTNYKL